MHGMIIHPTELSKYITSSSNHCDSLCLQQKKMDSSYHLVGQSWDDSIYYMVGEDLYSVHMIMKPVHDHLVQSVHSATEFLNEYNVIQKNGVYTPRKAFSVYSTKIQVGAKNMNKKAEQINYTDLDAMAAFISDLRNYIRETEDIFLKIQSEHRNIERYWKSPQYYQLGDAISSSKRKFDIALDNLKCSYAFACKVYRDEDELHRKRL